MYWVNVGQHGIAVCCGSMTTSIQTLQPCVVLPCTAIAPRRCPVAFRWKLWNTFHRPELLRKNMETCLKDLGLDYVDHVQLHYSFAMVPVEDETCVFTMDRTVLCLP